MSSFLFDSLTASSPVSDHHHEKHREDHAAEKVGDKKEEKQSSFHASNFYESDPSKLDPVSDPFDSSSSGQSLSPPSVPSDHLKRRVERENYLHVSEAIDSLLNVDSISFESHPSKPGELLKLIDDSKQFEELKFSSSGDYHILDNEADIDHINMTYLEILNKPRSDGYSKSLKETARNNIAMKFKEYKLETFTQPFTASKRGLSYKGINIIGILPGKFRGVPDKDEIVLLGAHYDTVETSPGIDDNGSGVISTLEVARILSNRGPLNHTVIFACFDLEELVRVYSSNVFKSSLVKNAPHFQGLLGSLAFVREYLIPVELMKNKSKFLGAYIIDMVLNYDSTPGSQTLPRDIVVVSFFLKRLLTKNFQLESFKNECLLNCPSLNLFV